MASFRFEISEKKPFEHFPHMVIAMAANLNFQFSKKTNFVEAHSNNAGTKFYFK